MVTDNKNPDELAYEESQRSNRIKGISPLEGVLNNYMENYFNGRNMPGELEMYMGRVIYAAGYRICVRWPNGSVELFKPSQWSSLIDLMGGKTYECAGSQTWGWLLIIAEKQPDLGS